MTVHSEQSLSMPKWLVLTPNLSVLPRRTSGVKSKFIEAIEEDDEEHYLSRQLSPEKSEPVQAKARKGMKYVLRFGKLRRVLALRKI